jgi:hypothetical protein
MDLRTFIGAVLVFGAFALPTLCARLQMRQTRDDVRIPIDTGDKVHDKAAWAEYNRRRDIEYIKGRTVGTTLLVVSFILGIAIGNGFI